MPQSQLKISKFGRFASVKTSESPPKATNLSYADNGESWGEYPVSPGSTRYRILTPFTYTQIVAAGLLGMLVLGELPDPWTLAGTALIVLAGLCVLRWAR
jgi:hypothetical protein